MLELGEEIRYFLASYVKQGAHTSKMTFLAHKGCRWILLGWTGFLAENIILSENRETIITKTSDKFYHRFYNTCSLAACASIAYGTLILCRVHPPRPKPGTYVPQVPTRHPRRHNPRPYTAVWYPSTRNGRFNTSAASAPDPSHIHAFNHHFTKAEIGMSDRPTSCPQRRDNRLETGVSAPDAVVPRSLNPLPRSCHAIHC